VNLLFRLLSPKLEKKLSSKKSTELFEYIAEDQSLQDFPDFLLQCADEAKNNYMYSENRIYKGKAAAFLLLREKILNSKKVLEKKRARSKDKPSQVKY
jgi:hypothetical protein